MWKGRACKYKKKPNTKRKTHPFFYLGESLSNPVKRGRGLIVWGEKLEWCKCYRNLKRGPRLRIKIACKSNIDKSRSRDSRSLKRCTETRGSPPLKLYS